MRLFLLTVLFAVNISAAASPTLPTPQQPKPPQECSCGVCD